MKRTNTDNVALIDRARCLTSDKLDSLAAAWYAARYDAWHAAWYAARDAAWYAGSAAWASAGKVARAAARALVVRDLITTDQYDTLTRTWREVIGPIHPDDPDMRGDTP